MFSFFRRKRDQKIFWDLMRAADEGSQRALVKRAFDSVGAPFENDDDSLKYCVNAVAAIVPIIMNEAGLGTTPISKADALSAGVLAFTISSHICRIIGAAPFEVVSSVALIPLLSNKMPHEEFLGLAPKVIDAYNKDTISGHVSNEIGQSFAVWLQEPTSENFDSLIVSAQLLSIR